MRLFDRRLFYRQLVMLSAAVLLLAALPTAAATAQPIPNPIDPNNGESTLLDLVNGLPINDIQNALDNFPVPYVVVASANGQGPFIQTKKAGSPIRIDADNSKSTGKGGKDIKVEVNTELFPTPHLVLSVERIGNPSYAQDISVLIAFPFDGFNDEDGAGSDSPNLFFGFNSTAAFNGTDYPLGGHAPQLVEFILTPDILAGTDHLFSLDIETTNADNPIRYFAGHFDGDPGSTPINALAMSALADPVPDTISVGLDVDASAIIAGGTSSGSFGLDWDASEPSRVTFDFLENEDYPFLTPDYNTTVTFDQMPTQESIDIDVDYAAGTIGVQHSANAVVGELTIRHAREDGLEVTAVASQVPTSVGIDLDMAGSVAIDVNDNTMDFSLQATQDGAGFPGSSGFLGYPLRYLLVEATDIPDTTATWDGAANSFSVSATNPGECGTCDAIGSISMVLDDDATDRDDPNLQFPPSQPVIGEPWADADRHVFSLVDDGTHGTAAARLLSVKTATLDLSDTPDIADLSETYTLDLREPAQPLTAYLDLAETSTFVDKDVEATCNVHDFPYGMTTFGLELPPPQMGISYQTNPAQGIDEISCFGNVGTLNFDLLAGDLPPEFSMTFDPEGLLDLNAGDGVGGPDRIGLIGMRLWDELGPDGLGAGTASLLGEVLRDARFRADDIPSFEGTWSDGPAGTAINYDTDAAAGAFAFLGGAQVEVSTAIEFADPLAPAGPAEPHYARLIDEGGTDRKQIAAGVFGMNEFSLTTTDSGGDRDISLHYRADEDHALVVDLDTALGGKFFPDYGIVGTLNVDDVPQAWDFDTNLATSLLYTASDGIDAINLVADITIEPMPAVFEATHVEASLIGLPSSIEYFLDPTQEGSAFVHMDAPITSVLAELTSDTSVLGEPYKHIRFSVQDIPANWDADWGLLPNPNASLITSSALGPVEVILSRDVAANTPAKYDLFTTPQGAVGYSDFTREIDRQYFRQGDGDSVLREMEYMGRLDATYDDTAQLDPGEDHFIMRENADGDIDFLSVKGTGFQSVAGQVGPTITASLTIPFFGAHPFFVGLEDSADELTVVQIDNIPDTTTVAIDNTMANLDFSSSPGDILVYQGPAGVAPQGVDALKLLVLNTPSFIHASWDLGFPGVIDIDTSNPTEIRLISQSGGDRTVVDFEVGDLNANWGFSTGDTTEKCQLDPPGCGEYLEIASVGFDFTATPAIDGFLVAYERIGSPMSLAGGGPAPGANEYIPRFSVVVDDFQDFDVSVEFEICLIGLCPILIPTAGYTTVIDLSGSVNFDWWDLGGGFLNFFGDPDYASNDPWDFWPVFHNQDNHLNPFG